MEPAVRARLFPDLLATTARRYSVGAKDLTELDVCEGCTFPPGQSNSLPCGSGRS